MIEIRNLSKVHRRGETEVHALRGATTSFEKASFNFVLGPSGSGKSTLLYLIGALDEPTAGEVLIEDRSVNAMGNRERDAYRREQVGFVFQSFNLLPNLSAIDNVLVPFVPRGIGEELRSRAEKLLGDVGLGERLDHTPNQLSGGEQQRVAIARALLKQPKLILADEPTGELDHETGAEVFSHLRRLHCELKTTVIVVTHDPAYIQSEDHILRLKDGRIENGEVSQDESTE